MAEWFCAVADLRRLVPLAPSFPPVTVRNRTEPATARGCGAATPTPRGGGEPQANSEDRLDARVKVACRRMRVSACCLTGWRIPLEAGGWVGFRRRRAGRRRCRVRAERAAALGSCPPSQAARRRARSRRREPPRSASARRARGVPRSSRRSRVTLRVRRQSRRRDTGRARRPPRRSLRLRRPASRSAFESSVRAAGRAGWRPAVP